MADLNESAKTLGDGVKNIFLAGIGALAITGEKSKELVDQLVAKGELTVEQGKNINSELRRRADDATSDVRDGALEARMSMMTPEERQAFAKKAAEIAAKQNAKDATVEAVDVEVEDVTAEAEQVAEDASDAPEADAPAQ